jgi:hypothetical protein
MARYKVATPVEVAVSALRLYVLVDDSILPRGGSKTAQVTHAVVEMVARHYPANARVKTWVESDKTLIILNASASEMESHRARFHADGQAAEGFLEPDLGNALTSVAFEPLTALEGAIFAHLQRAR